MIKVVRKNGETADILIKRFKKKCNHAGVRKEFKSRQAYIPPSERRRAKHTAAIRRMKRYSTMGWL